MNEEIMASELDFLLRFPIQPHVVSPVDFLSNTSWGGIRSLSAKDEFRYSKHNVHCNLQDCISWYIANTPALHSGVPVSTSNLELSYLGWILWFYLVL
jgi:hypothetical protein